MNPVRCVCHVDTTVQAVTAIHHVFMVGAMQVHSRYYYDVEDDVTVSMMQCHLEAILPLQLICAQYGIVVQPAQEQ